MKIKLWIYKIWYLLTFKLRKVKITITSAQLSGDGSLVDIRYWLSRPDKLQGSFNAYLIDETTKKRVYPAYFAKFGTIKTKHGKHTNNGVVLFYNQDNIIKAGSKVILVFDSYLSEQAEVS